MKFYKKNRLNNKVINLTNNSYNLKIIKLITITVSKLSLEKVTFSIAADFIKTI